jgi:cobalt-zinc-cadmium efflux system membrane fusion protein
MRLSHLSKSPATLRCVSGALVSLVLLATPAAVLAHGGGGGEDFGGGTQANQTSAPIKVDAETAKRLGIKVEPVTRQRLAVGIKTNGQIETLPNQQVEVTAPITGTVVELLAKPGDKVSKGQPVAVLSSPDVAQLRVDAVQKRADALPGLLQAQADLRLAEQNYERQQTLVAADIRQAQSQVAFYQERLKRYTYLASTGAVERLLANEQATQLAQAKASLAKAESRLPVLEAQAQLKRAQAAVEAAKSRVSLSSAGYQARLQQLGNKANSKGLITVVAPISGIVGDREISLGESVTLEAGSKPLMTILNDSRVYASANIYEKDLDQVQNGQQVRVSVASLPNRTFTGRIAVIGAVVQGDTRVIPVKAELDNSSRLLKPGMFAQMEVLTARSPAAVLAIPTTAVVDANGKKIVYVQNGDAYQPAEVTLGQTSGDLVEVKSGLFDGDRIVTQRGPQLYAQSLRGGSKPEADSDGGKDEPTVNKDAKPSVSTPAAQIPWWLTLPVGGAIAAGAFWAGRRTKPRKVLLRDTEYEAPAQAEGYSNSPGGGIEEYNDNHHRPDRRIESHSETKRPH